MKVGDIVNFQDNKGNNGNGVVNKIRSETSLDLKVKKRKGKFQLFLNVPKETKMSEKQKIAFWTPYISKDEKKEKSFTRKINEETKKQCFKSENEFTW